ncbi:cupin domain-containing protein [Telmatospirillum sp.]|uniref:cupin domain-containing protein n=1 Tax=Telmatospirillum sp. TaxID=2079197 RepID=UPI00284005AD|nr:cupin domain-containing protein [Telmatospirillum sp.]MDR3435920.1 cupin domain-containing protein [Telmatospirillum sp.]
MTKSSASSHIVDATKVVKVLSRPATPGEKFRDACERRIIHTSTLMSVAIDFGGGPWSEPDPMHHHPHEQTTYVAEGDILFLCEGRPSERLSAGDLYAIPPDIPHSIQLLSKTARLIDSFTPIREDFLPKK